MALAIAVSLLLLEYQLSWFIFVILKQLQGDSGLPRDDRFIRYSILQKLVHWSITIINFDKF